MKCKWLALLTAAVMVLACIPAVSLADAEKVEHIVVVR